MNPKRDLLVLAADKDMQSGLKSLFQRTAELNCVCRVEEKDIIVHPQHDNGVFSKADEYIRDRINNYKYLMVFLDYEGCGSNKGSEAVTDELEQRLGRNGWRNRVCVIVFDPELEQWVWNCSDELAKFFKSTKFPTYGRLRALLVGKGFAFSASGKPERPKEALEFVLRACRKPRSSSIYEKLGRMLSFRSCNDPGFLKFRGALQAWFPAAPGRQAPQG